MARDSLGDVEHLILVALLHLEGESYGVPIMKEIAARTGRAIARPAVYIALKRLESRGLVTSRVGESTAERGGRATRLFKLTKVGARQLRDARETFVRMWADAERLVQKGGPMMPAPPRWAVWLLSARLPAVDRDEVIGDLNEEFVDCPRSRTTTGVGLGLARGAAAGVDARTSMAGL